MTQRLKRAFQRAAHLPETVQDAIAEELLARIEAAEEVADTALLSEAALAQDWDRAEEDKAWQHLQ